MSVKDRSVIQWFYSGAETYQKRDFFDIPALSASATEKEMGDQERQKRAQIYDPFSAVTGDIDIHHSWSKNGI